MTNSASSDQVRFNGFLLLMRCICRCNSTVRISAFQADYEGSIPFTDSMPSIPYHELKCEEAKNQGFKYVLIGWRPGGFAARPGRPAYFNRTTHKTVESLVKQHKIEYERRCIRIIADAGTGLELTPEECAEIDGEMTPGP